MIARSNDDSLIKQGVNENCVVFYQIWQELVDSRTLDVYQYRVMNSLSLLIELKSVIEKTLAGFFYTDTNIEDCRKELLDSLKCDKVLNAYYKPLLNRLSASVGKKPSSDADKNRLLQQVTYAIKGIESDYLRYTLDGLKKSILSRQVKDIEFYSNSTVSQAVFRGWSSRGLKDLLRYFRSNGEFEDKWNGFQCELLDTNLLRHCVLINVPFRNQSEEELKKNMLALQKLGFIIKSHDEIVREFNEIDDIGRLINAEKRYIYINVNAKDIYSASHLAITKISEQLNFASFYNLVDAWDLQSVVIIPINLRNKYHKTFTAKQLYSTHDYLDSSGKIFEDTRRIFAKDDNNGIRDKLQGAFGYTNISRASLFQEEKYMNLWVALESLARTTMYDSIISNVKETVPAAMSLRYIYRIVRNFVEDCKRCQVSLDFSSCAIDINQETKLKMVEETIIVLKDAKLFEELKSKCKVNTLLYNRVDDVRNLVTETSYAKAKIENHYRRIQWQIQRLYRIRNEIAHAALREQASLIVYIEHLYHYLSCYISEIVTCLTDKGLSTIEEALCLIKDNYDVFISMSNRDDFEIVKNNVLNTGIINLILVET